MQLRWEKKLLMKLAVLKRKTSWYFLWLTTMVGGFLRFYNPNWDQGHFFHPDERNIAMAVTRIRFFSHLNPEFFAYGSFPIYLYRSIGELMVFLTHDTAWVSDWGKINIIGRVNSAFISTLTIPLVFAVGAKLWNTKVAWVAAFLMAFCPFLIQLAHFGITESLLIFWLMLILILSINIFQNAQKTVNYVLVGLVLGLAVGTKVSAVSFGIIPFVTFLLSDLKKSFKYFLAMGVIAITVFTITSPYVFLDRAKFMESINYENGVVLGKIKVPYILQFERTMPYFFQGINLFWLIGPTAAVGLAGILWLIYRAIKAKSLNLGIFLVFPIAYFAYVGSWFTKFVRYSAPVIPFLLLAGAFLIFQIRKSHRRLGNALIGIFLTISLLWSLAFFSIYTTESTRITASKWIYEQMAPGSIILQEHWDDGLPVDIGTDISSRFITEQLQIYDLENPEIVQKTSNQLAAADYLVISSRRLYGTLIHLDRERPEAAHYYDLLFNGQLGYHPIATFTSYPQLFGITINDDSSEETFQVYDHPKVLVFANSEHFSANRINSLLTIQVNQ
jgi:hypothetical protein